MKEIKILPFMGNEDTYKCFILKYKEYVDDDTVRNADVFLNAITDGLSLDDICYGECQKVYEEVAYHVLNNMGIECDFIPKGFLNISKENQKYSIIEISDDDIDIVSDILSDIVV